MMTALTAAITEKLVYVQTYLVENSNSKEEVGLDDTDPIPILCTKT